MSLLNITVDTAAITHNVRVLTQRTSAQVMAVVKADAYGHGLIPASLAARAGGATWLGVAQPHEALALRAAGDTGRILTWLYGPELPAADLVRADVDLSVNSSEVLGEIVVASRSVGRRARVHVAVDTGLGREGVPLALLPGLLELAKAAQQEGVIQVVGMWSHLAWADAPGHATIDRQAETFARALAMAQEAGVTLEVRHLANSACTLTRPDLHFDLVRPGIAVYGLPPVEDPEGDDFGLLPAMSVTSSIVLVKDVPAGQGVSYGHEYVTPFPTTLGLVSAGYADGVFRSAGSVADVAVRGRRYTIAGRVCMDQFVIDLGPATDVCVGDQVTLIGPDGPSAKDWARAVGTIDYEIVCRFGGLRAKGSV
ncbi:alanine racemase [Demequina sp. TTPB684]|uniref:alanine racemase n=1 Tax=unclassified Demequina TaxID=2620311 RepID=UPI001CF35D83|nr:MULTISPECIES: alanine racemase [unclassified Demequina]MCB2412935.1 alanine racemase [Demequina sp. TTPB684]UPU88438.1 alanine racemase [Demequina sp. TMPB413]